MIKVGDLVKLTWTIASHLNAPDVGIVTKIAVIKMKTREDIAVTAMFGTWQTTQLDEYFEVISENR